MILRLIPLAVVALVPIFFGLIQLMSRINLEAWWNCFLIGWLHSQAIKLRTLPTCSTLRLEVSWPAYVCKRLFLCVPCHDSQSTDWVGLAQISIKYTYRTYENNMSVDSRKGFPKKQDILVKFNVLTKKRGSLFCVFEFSWTNT